MTRRWFFLLLSTTALWLTINSLVSAQLFSREALDELEATPIGRAFVQVLNTLKHGYLYPPDDEQMIEGAIKGAIASLNDPFTHYQTPEEAARERDDLSEGTHEGIGIEPLPRDREHDRIIEIINVYPESPAAKAGISRGDIIVEIDGGSVRNHSRDEVIALLHGPSGSEVRVGVQHPNEQQVKTYTLVRDVVETSSVEASILNENIGYIRIVNFFNYQVADQLKEKLMALARQGIVGLILDLRDNSGGLLHQGVSVADEFLSSGDIAYRRVNGVVERLAAADAHAFTLPMVVLVNGNSASTSEIVAAALQTHGRALIVGEQTYGKGLVQTVLPLANGGQLTYLSFEWLTPDQASINGVGLTPDVIVPDNRNNKVVVIEGLGAAPGEIVEIIIGGELRASTQADEDGTFNFLQVISQSDGDEMIAEFGKDNALQVAHQTVLQRIYPRAHAP